MAATISSFERYFPVPTRRREEKVRPPITRGVSRALKVSVDMA